jgi:hypothetical protein
MKQILAIAVTALFVSSAGADVTFNDRWGSENSQSAILVDAAYPTRMSADIYGSDRWGSDNLRNVILVEAMMPVAKGCYAFRSNGNSDLDGSILVDIADGVFGRAVTFTTC